MGSVQPPSIQSRQSYEGEDMVNLCKALNMAVGLIAQMTPLQVSLNQKAKSKPRDKLDSQARNHSVSNSGRIILFTSSRARDLEQIQEFMIKSVEKCNNDIEAALNLHQNDNSYVLDFFHPVFDRLSSST